MGVYPPIGFKPPDFVNAYGHSYLQYQFGTRDQSGRADAILRSAYDIEFNNWVNHAENGARLSVEGLPQGGFARLLQNVTKNSVWAAPYVSQGGAYLLGWGINDLGFNTDTLQFRTSYQHALRQCISRCRSSAVRENTDASLVYGASWTQLAFTWDFASGTSVQQCTTAANDASHTITLTIPADYQGTPICLSYSCNPGVAGGTLTYGGTAGITGTDVVSNIQPSANVNRAPFVRRIKTLTSANAGQTITIICTQIDASGVIYFDGYWIEALTPPPVLVYNIARLTSTGYAVYTTAPNDSQVATWNTAIGTVIAEFDPMVQTVDIDSAIDAPNLGAAATGRTLATDGLHPTELGAGRMADATIAAMNRCQPTTALGQSVHFNPANQRTAPVVPPQVNTFWYTTETTGDINTGGTAYTPVAGDVWALPFVISQGTFSASQWSVEKVTSTVATTVFFAVFSDRQGRGYPQYLFNTPSNTTALSLGTGTAVFTSTTTSGSNGYLWMPADPGLYWLVLKIVVAGTTTLRTLTGQSRFLPNLATATGGGNVSYNGYKLTGQGSGVMAGFFPTGATPSTNSPFVGMKMTWVGP